MFKIQLQNLNSPWINSQNTIWETILHLGKKRCYKKGSIVIGNGDMISQLYYLYSGRLKFTRINYDGTEKTLWYLEKGNLFGEVPFLDNELIRSAFIAIDNCEVYTFSKECFNNKIMTDHPKLITNLLESLAHKTRVLSHQASDLSSLISRVSKLLLYAIARENNHALTGRVACTKGISQQELANILGVHRVTLNHAITQLKREQIVDKINSKCLIINNYERLLELAAD